MTGWMGGWVDGVTAQVGGDVAQHPLGPAINALEQATGGDRAVERELVVELFPDAGRGATDLL